jgi:hypothetical protein
VGDTLNFKEYNKCCYCTYDNFTGTLTEMMEALEEVQKHLRHDEFQRRFQILSLTLGQLHWNLDRDDGSSSRGSEAW